jgi:NAD+ diphosphatase
MQFVATADVTSASDQSPQWLNFVGERLVCSETLDGSYLPLTSEFADKSAIEPVVVGLLDGHPLLATALKPDVTLPAGAKAVGLRGAFGQLPAEWFAVIALASQLLHHAQSYRVCPTCAEPLHGSVRTRARECQRCNKHWFPRVAPCVIVLVHDGDRLLMTRQSRFPPGMFGLIAGFVEPFESLEECVHREVKEECGVLVDQLQYIGSQPWPFPEQLMVGYFARYAGGELVVDTEELETAQWFSVREMPILPPPISIARAMIDRFLTEKS